MYNCLCPPHVCSCVGSTRETTHIMNNPTRHTPLQPRVVGGGIVHHVDSAQVLFASTGTWWGCRSRRYSNMYTRSVPSCKYRKHRLVHPILPESGHTARSGESTTLIHRRMNTRQASDEIQKEASPSTTSRDADLMVCVRVSRPPKHLSSLSSTTGNATWRAVCTRRSVRQSPSTPTSLFSCRSDNDLCRIFSHRSLKLTAL